MRLLRSAGMQVQGFASGAEFLDSLASRTPDCVVLDLHMPGLTGFEVQACLARRWPQLPVIVVTGHHSAATEARVRAGGTVAYLRKPIDEQQLFDAIARAMP